MSSMDGILKCDHSKESYFKQHCPIEVFAFIVL